MPELMDKAKLVEQLPITTTTGSWPEPDQKSACTRIELSSATSLPILPPDVLWAWLGFYYQQTGQWILPPTEKNTTRAENPVNFQKASSSNIPDSTVVEKPADNSASAPELAYQFPLPSLIGYAPVAEPVNSKLQAFGYNYANSIYYEEALKITTRLNQNLSFGSQLVLALIIAWSRFPLFNINQRQGTWVTLPIDRAAREIKMRVSSFKIYSQELADAGLLEIGTITSGIISRPEYEQLRYDCSKLNENFGAEFASLWKPRSIQEKTLFYRLKINNLLSPALPVFNLSQNQLERLSNNTQTTPEVFPPNVPAFINEQLHRERLQAALASSFKSFHHEHDSNHVHDDVNKDKNFDKTEQVLTTPSNSSQQKNFLEQLNAEQKLKFIFLDEEAVFPNFTRKDGRATLDSREAVKFAVNPDLSLERLKDIYNLVKTSWLNGECRKNPLGLLHWSLTHNNDSQSNKPEPLEQFSKAGVINFSPISPMFHVNKRVSRQPRNLAASLSRFSKSIPHQSEAISQNYSSVAHSLFDNVSLAPAEIWSTVLEDDLAGRFRFPAEQLNLLEGSTLELIGQSPDDPLDRQTAKIILRSELEERQLSLATRKTIEMALRQRLGVGYSYSFRAADS